MDSASTAPHDCGLAIALPLAREQFFADLDAGAGKDFALQWKEHHTGWPTELMWQDYQRYAQFALEVAQEADRRGVLVRLHASRDDWQALVRARPVVALFAHCRTGPDEGSGDRVEFADRLYAIPEIVAAIPDPYDGVLDFTICYSLPLIQAVKRAHPSCTVVANKHAAKLDYRLAIYRQALRLMAAGQHSYVDALAEVHLAVLDRAKLSRLGSAT